MSTSTIIFIRSISTSCANHGKRNFRNFDLFNKRGMRAAKEQRMQNNYDEYLRVNKRGLKLTGVTDKWGRFHEIAERVPVLMVPDLEGFELKPYVTYKADDIKQAEFTAETLFNAVYASKIIDDFDNNKLNSDGSPIQPNREELLTPQEAKDEAGKTGTDIFTHDDLRPSWLY